MNDFDELVDTGEEQLIYHYDVKHNHVYIKHEDGTVTERHASDQEILSAFETVNNY